MILVLLLITHFINCSEVSLMELAEEAGTDKGRNCHNYAVVYGQNLEKFRHKKIKFLEIGFYKGASARMWDEYFDKSSELHFMDIDPEALKYTKGLSDRCILHLLNQEDANNLNEFISRVGGNFDIILDDGGHTMNQQLTSFKILFPHLKSKGIYIIEDLHTSYWNEYGNESTLSTQDYFKINHLTSLPIVKGSTMQYLLNLANDLNYFAVRTGCANVEKFPKNKSGDLDYFKSHIYSILFAPSVCFINKK